MHDLVIRNALLLDGLGSPPVHGDLAVAGGKIVEAGEVKGSSRETLKADGLALLELGILNLEEAVRRITSHPASVFGIAQRGSLKAGNQADLLLFDPATVNRGRNSVSRTCRAAARSWSRRRSACTASG